MNLSPVHISNGLETHLNTATPLHQQATPSLYAYLSTLTPDQDTSANSLSSRQASIDPPEPASTVQKVENAADTASLLPNDEAIKRTRSLSQPNASLSATLRNPMVKKYEKRRSADSSKPIPQSPPAVDPTPPPPPTARVETPPTNSVPNTPQRTEAVDNTPQEPPRQRTDFRQQQVPIDIPPNIVDVRRHESQNTNVSVIAKICKIAKEWWEKCVKKIIYIIDRAKFLLKNFKFEGTKISNALGVFDFKFNFNYSPRNSTIIIQVPDAASGERIAHQLAQQVRA